MSIKMSESGVKVDTTISIQWIIGGLLAVMVTSIMFVSGIAWMAKSNADEIQLSKIDIEDRFDKQNELISTQGKIYLDGAKEMTGSMNKLAVALAENTTEMRTTRAEVNNLSGDVKKNSADIAEIKGILK